ncbi:MAG TPA: aldo/keto reductase [Polyangiaceae bacterium]|nr:aldo/keto reductase [Polyangiaceae bacterium]
MERRPFGTTGLTVSALGFGAGPLGDARLGEAEAEHLLLAAADAGITFFDSARSYGLSEERLGRALAARRDAIVLCTKVGYGVEGLPDWTGACVARGIDDALGRLRTDRLDVALLHSCPADVALRDDILGALDAAKRAGKVRVVGYSGDNEDLAAAIDSGRFDAVEMSLSFVDQGAIDRQLAAARARGLGVIAKRPIGNAPWRFDARPDAHDLGEYWARFRALGFDPGPLAWDELALRFAAFLPGVSTTIVGTTNPANLRRNLTLFAQGPLPEATAAALREAYRRADPGWRGMI